MAKAKNLVRKPKVKKKSARYYGLNITLQSVDRKGPEVYEELVKRINDEQMHFVVGPEITMVLRTLHVKHYEYNGKQYPVQYGKFLRFNNIKNWYNQKDAIFTDYKLPANLVPNAFETDYVFIPAAHKFFIKYNNRIKIGQARIFMLKALDSLTHANEKLKVSIMTSTDTIESILSAKVIKSLDVTVSYTNDDIGGDADELIDKMLKEAQSGEVSIELRPDATGTLNGDSSLVKGFIGVAQNNGTVTARIVNANGKPQTVQTEDYPEKINLTVLETNGKAEDEKEILFKEIMEKYRTVRKVIAKKVKKANGKKRKGK